MTAILEPRTGDLTVEIATAELLDLEAELMFRMIDGPGLTDSERYQLVAVVRELNRRWSVH